MTIETIYIVRQTTEEGGGVEERKEEVNTDQKRFHLPTENGRKLLLWRRREEGKTKFGEEQRQ